MEAHAEQLGDKIESVRQDFRNKRNDQDVVGLPPEPEVDRERQPPVGETHSADPNSPPVEGTPEAAESGAASIVEDSIELPGNPGDEGVHGEDPDRE